jgi:hypothetical protein
MILVNLAIGTLVFVVNIIDDLKRLYLLTFLARKSVLLVGK